MNTPQLKMTFELYNKYQIELIRLARRCLERNYNILPLTESDIINQSLAHFIEKDLLRFNPLLKIKFEHYFFCKIKHSMLNYCRLFHKKNFEIMNESIELDETLLSIKIKRTHIDYSNLTIFEKKIINKIFYDNYLLKDVCHEYHAKEKKIEKILEGIYEKMKKKSYFY